MKNQTIILIFPRCTTYLLICCISHLKNNDTVPNEQKINKFIEMTSDSKLHKCYDNIIIKE